MGVCHRDIKPQNLLLDTNAHVVKLCDFGRQVAPEYDLSLFLGRCSPCFSAKQLVKGEPNIAYICSRYYRAPELIFGATDYSPAIDVWSFGCVFAEMLLGTPIFPGESNVDQLVEIIKVVGTPTREEIHAMNPNYTDFKFPQIKPHPWAKVFRNRAPPEAIDLVSKLLRYAPLKRLSPLEACAHPFFDELRDPAQRLPSGAPLSFIPPLSFESSFFLFSLNPSRPASSTIVRVHRRRNPGCRARAHDAPSHARALWSPCRRPSCRCDTCGYGCRIEEVGCHTLIALVFPLFSCLSRLCPLHCPLLHVFVCKMSASLGLLEVVPMACNAV